MKRVNKYIKVLSVALITSLAAISCADTYLGLEQQQTDTVPPQMPNIDNVISKSGAVEIHFSLAKGDADITQVIASYTNQRGQKLEFTASRYSSSILVEGFYGTDETTIDLVAVDNSGNVSETVIVKASPQPSPIEIAFQSLTAETGWGGVKIDWENTAGDLLIFDVLTEDTTVVVGDTLFVEDPSKRIYTREMDEDKTITTVRTFPPFEQKFGFVISDSWGNRSDTLVSYVTPIEEFPVDHNYIEAVNWFNWQFTSGSTKDFDTEGVNQATGVLNDGLFYNPGYGPKTLFDGSTAGAFYVAKYTRNLGQADAELVDNVYCTYDLKVDTRLSRMELWWRSHLVYKAHSVKHFRLWGTDDNNAEKDIKFPETWTLIGEYIVPDALDKNNITNEEKEAADGYQIAVLEDNVNENAEPTTTFRYLRIEMLDSFDDHSVYTWNEMKLYGTRENKYY